jgi:hypothetical protein
MHVVDGYLVSISLYLLRRLDKHCSHDTKRDIKHFIHDNPLDKQHMCHHHDQLAGLNAQGNSFAYEVTNVNRLRAHHSCPFRPYVDTVSIHFFLVSSL